MNVKTASATILIGVFTTSVSMAAKPLPPQPPQFAALTTCDVKAGVAFPAIAYSQSKYRMVKKFGGTQVYDGADFFIANSDGSCSIKLHTGTREYSIPAVSYRQIGDFAFMAYNHDGGIRLLKFRVSTANGVHTVQDLPPAGTLVFAYDQPSAGINHVELSADAKTIYYAEEHRTADERWVDTVNSVDVSTDCSSPACPKTVIYDQFPDNTGVGHLSINGDENRLFTSIHFRVADIRTISLLEKQGDGSWAFRNVLSDQDTEYATVDGFASTSLGMWNYDGSGVREVLAFVVERSTGDSTDIVDVTNCTAVRVESCLAGEPSEISVVRTGIAGVYPSFTSTPSSPTDVSLPNLLVLGGGWILDVDLDVENAVPIPVVEGFGQSGD